VDTSSATQHRVPPPPQSKDVCVGMSLPVCSSVTGAAGVSEKESRKPCLSYAHAKAVSTILIVLWFCLLARKISVGDAPTHRIVAFGYLYFLPCCSFLVLGLFLCSSARCFSFSGMRSPPLPIHTHTHRLHGGERTHECVGRCGIPIKGRWRHNAAKRREGDC
jgi:hypothetical protein